MVTENKTILDGIRQKVFLDRYALKDTHGNPIEEHPEQMWRRVAKAIASIEKTDSDRKTWEDCFYYLMEDFKFVPGGRILSGAGTGFDVTYYNCYVIPSPEDSRLGIFDNLKVMTEIMARGGGVGINLSTLRPRGSYIKTVNGTASGPCSWAQLYSVTTGDVIQQGGCFGPDEYIETNKGAIAARELADRIESGEFLEAMTHKGPKPFISFFRNGIQNLFEVNTSQGYAIRVTKDHKMGVMRNGKITTIALSGLRIGSHILILDVEHSTCSSDSITSIIPVPPDETFDFEVQEVHMLAANGIYTSNSRRGALMLMLNDDHPDIEEFITVKKQKGMIEHANLSICVSDKFMRAVKYDADWDLIWQGETQKIVKARVLWDLICTSAWESAEPGLVFMERCNEQSNTWYYEKINCVNPCGEQPLGDWGVCNLGAINLAAFAEAGRFDYSELASITRGSMRFLDNVIDVTTYFIPENKEAQLGTRRTGLGTMGLADALIKMKIPYGSLESLQVIDSIYATIRNAAYEASSALAGEKGAFPKFFHAEYIQGKFIRRLPSYIKDAISANGIRNAVLLTQAPTGTTSLLAGVSSGIEPVYDFAMIRRDRTGEHVMYHPLIQEWYESHEGEVLPDYFVSSKDLTPEEHVAVQARIQDFTDSSISKTVNAPNDHTVEQVQKLYQLAYDEGCKGVTYYRDGSRDAVLTRIADEKVPETPVIDTVDLAKRLLVRRPEIVHGYTRQIQAPEGKANITINSDDAGLFEVFVNVGKAGSDIAALSEALGRLVSLNLQTPSLLTPEIKATEIIKQLRGIGGSRSVGFGISQVRSLPDAVARALELHTTTHGLEIEEHDLIACMGCAADSISTGMLCPECGCDSVVREEGCKKCYNCGYSEC